MRGRKKFVPKGKGKRRPTSSRLKRATKSLPVIPEKLEHFFFFDERGQLKNRALFTALTLGRPVIGLQKSLQTRVTPAVKAFADRFKPTRPGWQGELEMAEQIVDRIAKLEMVKVKPSEAELLYGKRTAEDILSTGKIPALFPPGLKRPAWGCSDQVNALVAVLRAKGIKTDYVRTVYGWWEKRSASFARPHSVALIHLGNRQYIADPFLLSQGEVYPGNPLVRQVGALLRVRIKSLKSNGWWRPGQDAWGLGIKNIWDYFRYINPEKYRNDQKAFKEFLAEFEKKKEG